MTDKRTPDLPKWSKAIRSFRDSLGIGQTEFGRRCGLGQSTIGALERGGTGILTKKVIEAIRGEFPELGDNLALLSVQAQARSLNVKLKTVESEADELERQETLSTLNELKALASDLIAAIEKREG